MSLQFGRCTFDGAPIDAGYIGRATAILSLWSSDGISRHIQPTACFLYAPFPTTKEAQCESQPCLTRSGAVLLWDGRLDNRADLIPKLRDVLAEEPTDVEIVTEAYERWGTASFAKLIGDWALSIFDANHGFVLLAKDFIGTRPLYYVFDGIRATWSTVLDSLIRLADGPVSLNEEYVAGWCASFPAAHLTPYVGVHSVPPSFFVRLCHRTQSSTRFWDLDPGKRVRYGSDDQYEEHFRMVLNQSITRRLRANSPILAELSGGIDSCTIVCVADRLMARGHGETPRLDTVSYFDDSEPNWDERPYFTKIEDLRGRIGCHIPITSASLPPLNPSVDNFRATPASFAALSTHSEALRDCLLRSGNRVLLSGIGGDEILGGVPTPIPELADLLATGRLRLLFRQLVAWALAKRMPVLHLAAETVSAFLPIGFVGRTEFPPWLDAGFVARYQRALQGYESRFKLLGPPPCFQRASQTLNALRRQLACSPMPQDPPYEKRYPYLDRDLMEFAFAIPREQLLRPTERRSLMRRALGGIVPDIILHRRRKAYVIRGPLTALGQDSRGWNDHARRLILSEWGIVDRRAFINTLRKTCSGHAIPVAVMLRTLALEGWLCSLDATKSEHFPALNLWGTAKDQKHAA